jgi:hypothetical protein
MDLLALVYNFNQLRELIINDGLRVTPFLTGLRVSSIPRWLTWFWFRNRSLLEPRLSHECSPLISLCWAFLRVLPFRTSGEPNRGHPLEQLVVILSLSRECVFVSIRCRENVCQSVATLWPLPAYPLRRESVLTEALFRNGRPLWLHYSGFHAMLTEPLPSNVHIRHNII